MLPLRTRQALAITILVLAVLMVWQLVIWPVVDLAVSRQSDVVVLSDKLRQLRAVERHAPALGRREQNAAAELQSLNVIWSGPSQAAITAAMQDLIRTAAQQGGGSVSSSSALPSTMATQDMLGVRARVDGSLDMLQHVLTTIDTAHPKLFLTNLDVSASDSATKERPQQLSCEFSVVGYVAGEARAH